VDDLESWLTEWYPSAYRSACFVLRDRGAAEEAVQEAFLRVWRFRAAIPAGDGRRAWLYRVVVNACMSRARTESRWRARNAGAGDWDEPAAVTGLPAEAAESNALAAAVTAALADLPEHLRVPTVLRYYAGLSEREIATAIGRRPGTVKSRLYDARQRLSRDPRLAAWVDDLAEVSP
jgi:RNA polymerase sigma-70 factor (ECF subfamily)